MRLNLICNPIDVEIKGTAGIGLPSAVNSAVLPGGVGRRTALIGGCWTVQPPASAVNVY